MFQAQLQIAFTGPKARAVTLAKSRREHVRHPRRVVTTASRGCRFRVVLSYGAPAMTVMCYAAPALVVNMTV